MLFTACKLAKDGFYALLAAGDSSSYLTYSSISRALQIPFVNWAFPPTDVQTSFEISLRPPVHHLVGDFVMAKKWVNVVYMYSGHDGRDPITTLPSVF